MKGVLLASALLASSFAFAWGFGDPPLPSNQGLNTNPRHAPAGWYGNRKLTGNFTCYSNTGGFQIQVVKGWANFEGGHRAVFESAMLHPSPNELILVIDEPAYGFAVPYKCYR